MREEITVEENQTCRAEGTSGEIHGPEGKDHRIQSMSPFIIFALTAVLLALLLPKIWNLEILRLGGLFLRPLSFGFVVLVLAYGIYTLDLRRKLNHTHEELARHVLRAETAESLSLIDPLTQVFNRRYLDRILPKETSRADRLGSTFTLLMIDLDDFKSVNTRFGHLVGDLVLRELAELLNRCLRRSDAIVRYGGDEFIVVLSDANEQQAQYTVERLFRHVELWNGENSIHGYKMSVSCGTATYSKGANTRDLIECADRRMYRQKADDTVSTVPVPTPNS